MRKLKISNFRDVSGYRNSEGKIMIDRKIFRGASLHLISSKDAEYLSKELGIKYILDYRDKKEAESKPDVLINDLVYERMSALSIKSTKYQGFDFGELLNKDMNQDNLRLMLEYLRDGYTQMAFNNPAYHKLFELLLKNDGNVYFHCSAGKDRTGIGAFLVMIALGMSEEDAIKEYLLSNKYLESFVQEFYLEHNISQEYKKYTDMLLFVNRENIMLTIQSIKNKYQNYDAFLEKEYGIDEEKRNILKLMYCE